MMLKPILASSNLKALYLAERGSIMKTAKKSRSIESRHSRNGFLFILPWLIGVTIGFDDSLLCPVVSIFLHEEAHVAGFVFNGFSIGFNFSPSFGSFGQTSSFDPLPSPPLRP